MYGPNDSLPDYNVDPPDIFEYDKREREEREPSDEECDKYNEQFRLGQD